MAHAEVEEQELLRAMSWFDGFVVAMANPAFLITGLGFSVVSLGGWGAVIVWLISVCLGRPAQRHLLRARRHVPGQGRRHRLLRPRGVEALLLSFIGPMAAFGYWIGWSVVLAVNGVIVGGLLQAEFFEGTAAEGSSWNHTVDLGPIDFTFNFQIFVGHRAGHRGIWADQLPRRAAGRVGRLRDGRPAPDPARSAHVPALRHGRVGLASNLVSNIDMGSSRHRLAADHRVAVHHVLVRLRLRVLRDVRRGVQGPRARRGQGPARGGPLRHRRLRPAADRRRRHGRRRRRWRRRPTRSTSTASSKILGGGCGHRRCCCSAPGIVLSMNTATLDGSRALYGISRADMTLKWLGAPEQAPGAGQRDDAGRGPEHPDPGALRRPERRRSRS